jgi:membrane protein DedA with SNARE-associated domain
VAVHVVEVWLQGLPPILVYLIVTLVIGVESMGVPLPGEIALVTASLMAVNGITNPYAVAIAASIGAIVGDSIGYLIGRRGGRRLLERFGRRFPNHFGPPHLAKAEQMFDRWGVWAVFIGRFIALLRILAGPLAGALRIPYRRFLAANAAGGIVWSFGTTFLIYGIGQAAEKWLSRFSWVALAVAVVCGIVTTLWLRRRAARHMAETPAGDKLAEEAPAGDEDEEQPGEKEAHAPAALGSDS